MNMQIADYKELIRNFPYREHSFDVKHELWKNENPRDLINHIFEGKEILTLNRYDLYNSLDTSEFVIKTLLWGYPTKGRGKNISKLMNPKNFTELVNVLNEYRDSNVTIDKVKTDISKIDGLGLSTMSKFMCFLNTRVEEKKALILDLQIINAVKLDRFADFKILHGLTYKNAIDKYVDYLSLLAELSDSMDVKPEQIEMFLFTFGKNISEVRGKEFYGEICNIYQDSLGLRINMI